MTNIVIGDPELNTPQARAERGACVSCAQWPVCRFDQKRLGGFKGRGRKNVGYRLVTDPTENANGKEDFCSCEAFIDSGLQNRMIEGQSLMAQGIRGEMVSIVAQEGDFVTIGVQMGFNSRNQIARPIRTLIPALKAAGYEVNADDNSGNVEFRDVEYKIEVPVFKAVNKLRTAYSSKIAGLEESALVDNSDMADAVWAEARARKAAQSMGKPVTLGDGEPVTPAAVDAPWEDADTGNTEAPKKAKP